MSDELWSEEEFAAAVNAYLEMLVDERAGRPFNRAEIRRRLVAGPLEGRTESSVEFRMQNISAVMELHGGSYLPGYLPAKRVGPRGTRIISELLEADPRAGLPSAAPRNSGQPGSPMKEMPETPRIFVTGMWGFNPDKEGYVGFTKAATRDRLLKVYRPGDLMVIVGQASAYSVKADVGRLIGLVELEPRPIEESDRMSPETYQVKVATFGPDRWRYALPIKRAWRMGREVKATHVIGESYSQSNAQSVGAGFVELTPADTQTVFGLPVRAVPVWGEPDWKPDDENANGEQRVSLATRRGPPPSFGSSMVTREDGENHLYLMRLTGCVDAMFPNIKPSHSSKAIIKVGRSNDPKRRLAELNAGFPEEAAARWELLQTQKFKSAQDAHDAETALLNHLKSRQQKLGGEFAWVPEREISTLLVGFVGAAAFSITGSLRS